MSTNVLKHIEEVYKKNGYLDKYGDSLVMTILILIVFFGIFTYLYVKINIEPIKKNWNRDKCKPHIIPFAGIINPDPSKTASQSAKDNFYNCMNTILQGVSIEYLRPIYATIRNTNLNFTKIIEIFQNIRKMFNFSRIQIRSISEIIMARFLNVLMPIRITIIKLKAIIQKMQGVLVTALYTSIGAFFAMKSFLGAFIQLLLIGLGILAGMIVLMWIFPWTWPMAIASSAFFALLAIPLAIVIIYLQHIVDITKPQQKPSCFDKNTVVKTKNGEKKISELNIGDILEDNSRVTATFKLNGKNTYMYSYCGIIVSGDHRVIDNEKYIYVKDHPKSVFLPYYNEKYIYCINTCSKKIIIKDITFLDWDDMTEEEDKTVLTSPLQNPKSFHNNKENKTNYDYLNGGFIETTKLQLEDGTIKEIKDIEIGDKLLFGGKVYGKVQVEPKHVQGFKIDNKTIVGGNNLQGYHISLGEFTSIHLNTNVENYHNNKTPLYHLLTEKDYFMVNTIKFYDYNSCLDKFLKNPRKFYYQYKNIIF